jgi:hypothetical protein
MTRLGHLRYIANGVGRPLPESIDDRIRNNLTGSAATPGHLIRSMIPFLAVYAGVALLLPGSLALRVVALVLAVVLAPVDSLVFFAISRRLDQHCRAEDLHENVNREKNVSSPESSTPTGRSTGA